MKKAIPILLVVFLCLLVAFSAVCEYRQQHPVPEEMLVSFESHGKCWFKNAEGESLTYRDDGAVFGTMERYESSYGGLGYDNCIDIDMFRVPSSASFTVEGIQGQSSVEVIWGKAYSGSAEVSETEIARIVPLPTETVGE